MIRAAMTGASPFLPIQKNGGVPNIPAMGMINQRDPSILGCLPSRTHPKQTDTFLPRSALVSTPPHGSARSMEGAKPSLFFGGEARRFGRREFGLGTFLLFMTSLLAADSPIPHDPDAPPTSMDVVANYNHTAKLLAQIKALQHELAFTRSLTNLPVPSQLIQDVANSTGTVRVYKTTDPALDLTRGNRIQTGSYVIFQETPDAFYVLTNEHVVTPDNIQPDETLFVTLRPSRLGTVVSGDFPEFLAEVLYTEEDVDLALLKLSKEAMRQTPYQGEEWIDLLKPAPFSLELRAGQFMFQVGAGNSRHDTVSSGIVSRQRWPVNATTTGIIMHHNRNRGEFQYGETVASYGQEIPETKDLVHTALSEKGNSGSGIFNAQGHCLGITRAIQIADNKDNDDEADDVLNPFYNFGIRTNRVMLFIYMAVQHLQLPDDFLHLMKPDGTPLVFEDMWQ